MIGRPLAEYLPRHVDARVERRELLRVERLIVPGKFEDVSFSLRAGEVVGTRGTRRRRTVGGRRRRFSGSSRATAGTDLRARTRGAIDGPRDAIALGIGLVPEDRKRQGLVLARAGCATRRCRSSTGCRADVASSARRGARAGARVFSICCACARRASTRRSPGSRAATSRRSCWRAGSRREAKILILDEPTRGVDVGAKAEIHALIGELAAQGAGDLLISSELPELLSLSTRILVLRSGRLVGEMPRARRRRRAAPADGGRRAGARGVMTRARFVAALVAVAVASGCAHLARSSGGAWVATWKAPPQATEDRNMPPAPLAGATIRQVAHVTLGGSRWRVRLSNEFGDVPIVVSAGTIAQSEGADRIATATSAKSTFRGDRSVSIPAGTAAWSDEMSESVHALSEVAITLHLDLARGAGEATGHPGSRTTSFIVPGNHVADAALPSAAKTEHWYVVSGLEVMAPAGAAAVVVLGNSIADGRGSGTDKNDAGPRISRAG